VELATIKSPTQLEGNVVLVGCTELALNSLVFAMSIQEHVLNIRPTTQGTSRKLNIFGKTNPGVEPRSGCSSLQRWSVVRINGDIIADLSFGSILRFREQNKAQITVGS
jgi:hypothetical protein